MIKTNDKLLFDLCSRLPYSTMVHINDGTAEIDAILTTGTIDNYEKWNVKPYLRPMSSMTAKEESEYHFLCEMEIVEVIDIERECFFVWHDTIKSIDWLNAHHFDYRGLIEKNLAIEAPEGMYKS